MQHTVLHALFCSALIMTNLLSYAFSEMTTEHFYMYQRIFVKQMRKLHTLTYLFIFLKEEAPYERLCDCLNEERSGRYFVELQQG